MKKDEHQTNNTDVVSYYWSCFQMVWVLPIEGVFFINYFFDMPTVIDNKIIVKSSSHCLSEIKIQTSFVSVKLLLLVNIKYEK